MPHSAPSQQHHHQQQQQQQRSTNTRHWCCDGAECGIDVAVVADDDVAVMEQSVALMIRKRK